MSFRIRFDKLSIDIVYWGSVTSHYCKGHFDKYPRSLFYKIIPLLKDIKLSVREIIYIRIVKTDILLTGTHAFAVYFYQY